MFFVTFLKLCKWFEIAQYVTVMFYAIENYPKYCNVLRYIWNASWCDCVKFKLWFVTAGYTCIDAVMCLFIFLYCHVTCLILATLYWKVTQDNLLLLLTLGRSKFLFWWTVFGKPGTDPKKSNLRGKWSL